MPDEPSVTVAIDPPEPAFAPLDPNKFRDPERTATGERRARVDLVRLETLWINTGTLCNLTCRNCYIESSPSNDRLVYITRAELCGYLDEIQRDGLGTRSIAFTGGEPFMNPDMIPMLEDSLGRGFEALVLTNAMRPMMKVAEPLLDLGSRYGSRLSIRVSVDHYTRDLHELERGRRAWKPALEGLRWLSRNGFSIDIAGRQFSGEPEATIRDGFA
ncbi:MAG: radical SAM protein, partial [Wenzhouxiangella sp.]|nr:radical SAM protein [Wenzhouxiangella sp.]